MEELLDKLRLADELTDKIRKIRVLRVDCEESSNGKFRVHLPEDDWNEIEKLVRK